MRALLILCFFICFSYSKTIAQQNTEIISTTTNCDIGKNVNEKDFIMILYGSINCRACFDQLNEYFKQNKQKINKPIYVGVIGDYYSSLDKRMINNSLKIELLPNVDFKIIYINKLECDIDLKTQKEFPALLTTINDSNNLILYPYKFLFNRNEINLPSTYLKY